VRKVRVTLFAALAVIAALSALHAGAVTAQTAASIVETGWWSRQPAGTPGSAFEVARLPDGDVSVTAFRIRVDGSVTSAQLQLAEVQASGTPSLQLCPTLASWTAAAPGPWEARPAPTCGSTPVRVIRNEVQKTWTLDIRSFLSSGQPTVSVMLVPAPDEAITVPPPTPAPPVGVPVAPPATLPPPSTIPGQAPVPLPFSISFSGAQVVAEGSGAASPAGDLGAAPAESPAGDLSGSDSFFATPDIPTPAQQAVAAPVQVEGRFPQRGDVGVPGGPGANQPWGRLPLLTLAAAAIGAGTSVGRTQLRQRGLLAG
jgi:hypothetical protein